MGLNRKVKHRKEKTIKGKTIKGNLISLQNKRSKLMS
ncbi:hypothetical protein MBFIL_14940 [Methanobrevibacter filiformis]|uniref:Uncharacterized protein n=1 Tax=Methanobrevibacter filiformis TaxID=55758 RepID=A0A165ZWF6_9EURY|nr:hypothetical protein MBFIL_14940 [Methanobrevibacter filiformis]